MPSDILAEKIWFFLTRYIVIGNGLTCFKWRFEKNFRGTNSSLLHFVVQVSVVQKVDTECYSLNKFYPVDRKIGFQNTLIV